jgi:hypothetical protein
LFKSKQISKIIASTLIILMLGNPFCMAAVNTAEVETAPITNTITMDKSSAEQVTTADNMKDNNSLTEQEKALNFGCFAYPPKKHTNVM